MKNRHAILLLGVAGIALAGVYLSARQEGYLVADVPGMELQLKSGFGRNRAVRLGVEPVGLPANTYRPTWLGLAWQEDGDTWRIGSHGPWGASDRIKVERGRTTAIAWGPPLSIEPHVEVSGDEVFVDLRVFGRAGEQYVNRVWRRDGRIAPPRVKIVDEEGTVLVTGKFEYG